MTTVEEMLAQIEVIRHLYPKFTLEKYESYLKDMIPHNYKQVAVFEANICVGISGFWSGVKLWSGKYLEIDHFVIAPDFRSSGVGSKMVAYLEEKAKREYCKMITLDAYTNNFKAHKFFYNQGFIPKGFHFLKEI